MQLILMAQPDVTCIYYVTTSFTVSARGTLVVDVHNLVVNNPPLSVSLVSSVCSDFHLVHPK